MLDKLIGSALQGVSGGTSGSHPLLQLVMSMLSNNGQFGGLGGLLQQFQQAGLGPQMQSWISTGQNMPIDLSQLAQVFGQSNLEQMASSVGMDSEQFGNQLSQLLPHVVDQATPNGSVPVGGIDDALASLSQLMPR